MEAGLRIVIRNHQGQILASLSEKVNAVKAMVAVKAISFASDLGFSSIIPERDWETIIKVLRSDEFCFASFGLLISSFKNSIDVFNYISFSHSRSKARNTFIAHNLVKYVRHFSGYLVWMEDILSHLCNVLLAEYN